MNDSLLWQVRAYIYQRFADTTIPPDLNETARRFEIEFEEVVALYKELHARHAVFLDLETLTVSMANPFSGIPTDFRVHANSKTYYANCAWDMLGIPAALHCDALIDAVCTESNDPVRLEIKNGQIYAPVGSPIAGDGDESKLFVHFPLPFARWYDDLVFT